MAIGRKLGIGFVFLGSIGLLTGIIMALVWSRIPVKITAISIAVVVTGASLVIFPGSREFSPDPNSDPHSQLKAIWQAAPLLHRCGWTIGATTGIALGAIFVSMVYRLTPP